MPIPLGYNWTGFYIGAHAGYAGDQERKRNVQDTTGFSFATGNGNNARLFTASVTNSVANSRIESAVGGGQVGYNYQLGSFVVGVEGDASFGDLSKRFATSSVSSFSVVGANPAQNAFVAFGSSFSARYNIDAFGTLRGRVGYAFNNVLLYATGGAVIADVTMSGSTQANLTAVGALFGVLPAFASSTSQRTSKIEVAPTVGGGVEIGLAPNWTFKAEYLYLMLPDQVFTITPTTNFFGGLVSLDPQSKRFQGDMHLGRIGVNYKF